MNRSLDSLRSYLGQGGGAPRWSPTPGVVVLGSGKGGVGTSTLSALLALAGAREGRQVLLVDGDENVGSLHLLLGMADAGPGLGSLRGGDMMPEDLLRPVADALWLLPGGGGGVDATLPGAAGERRLLFRRISELYARFDLVVVDGGSQLASVVAACSAGAERLVALTAPDRVSMAATYALLKVGRERFPLLPMEILVNWGEGVTAEEVFRMMAAAGQRFLGLQVAFGGSIPRDHQVVRAMEDGISLLGLSPGAPAVDAMGALHARLSAEQARAKGDPIPVLSFPRSG